MGPAMRLGTVLTHFSYFLNKKDGGWAAKSYPQLVKLNLDKKLDPKQKTTQPFNIEA